MPRVPKSFAVVAFFGLATVAAAQPPQRPPPAARGPSMELASEAVQTAVAACKAKGFTVAASVVDSAGVQKALLASDGAHRMAVESSSRKAATAVAMKDTTSAAAERAKGDPALAAKIAADPTLLAVAGGAPLMVGADVIGGIGVGGGPSAEDEACALAGFAKIKDRLK